MNSFESELSKLLGTDNLSKIQNETIGIAGLGGLGSNCAQYLVRSGVRSLILCDHDKVELSNLNRQFYFQDQIDQHKASALKDNLLKINPDLKINLVTDTITSSNVKSVFVKCGIVVEAFDAAACKSMLIESLLPLNRFLVSASGLAGFGNSDAIISHRIKDTLWLIGDLHSQVSPTLPPLAPRVNIAAAKQADTILTYILTRP